ncbi:hypothetical protein PoB_004044700 [Plakobranchus ocellatus]|uniref:Uncharacterized protein n=1 Tax=Plakobranchus ocellatus TaxID=259542 RepID=A0AAV4B358_9GAST|nr:hypothetical protein PoB_004044700 [Plakobranchus ocellatus]
MAGLEPATEGSLQISERTHKPLCTNVCGTKVHINHELTTQEFKDRVIRTKKHRNLEQATGKPRGQAMYTQKPTPQEYGTQKPELKELMNGGEMTQKRTNPEHASQELSPEKTIEQVINFQEFTLQVHVSQK